jgi:5-methylcytosine-specific restriction protein A
VHTREREARRGTAHQRGYTSRWARYSKAWLKKYPLCGMRRDGQINNEYRRPECIARGPVQAECVDHIRAASLGGAFWDPANHQSLCLNCNRVKGIKYEGGFGR